MSSKLSMVKTGLKMSSVSSLDIIEICYNSSRKIKSGILVTCKIPLLPFFGCLYLFTLHFLDADGETTGAGQMHLQLGLGRDLLCGD